MHRFVIVIDNNMTYVIDFRHNEVIRLLQRWATIRVTRVEAGISVTSKRYWIVRHNSGSQKTPPGAEVVLNRAASHRFVSQIKYSQLGSE